MPHVRKSSSKHRSVADLYGSLGRLAAATVVVTAGSNGGYSVKMEMPSRNGGTPLGVPQGPINSAVAKDALLQSGNSGGNSGGMEAWQTSVEGRLDSLDRRVGNIESGVNDMRERLVRVETKIEHLPSKDFVVKVMVATVTIMSAVVGLLTNLDKILHH